MANVRLEMDAADAILLKRHLDDNGEAQRFFTHEVRRVADPYVPMQTGMMKNSAIETANTITYPQPYSKRQYYGNGSDGSENLRGRLWIPRMWSDRGKEIVQSVADYVGGRAE